MDSTSIVYALPLDLISWIYRQKDPTVLKVSLPQLRPRTPLSTGFDSCQAEDEDVQSRAYPEANPCS